MKRGLNGLITRFILVMLTVALMLTSVACSKKEATEDKKEAKTVNIHMWGGSDSINNYIDKWVAPKLKQEMNITLKRVPITDPKDVINKLIVEKKENKVDGSVDIIWMNGENFKMAKDSNILNSPFTSELENFKKYVNAESNDIKYDFGEETKGLEAPWGKVQFVYIYDSNKIKNPPKSFKELKEFVKENPGKVTYPVATDFTGSAFIRQAFYETTGGFEKYLKPINESELIESSKPLWTYLNDIKPYLWEKGKTYPESLTKLDQLYASGEVWMTMGYDEARAENEIKKGVFPASTKTMVFETGTLANTHFLTIPFNSPNKDGAKKVIDFLLSPEAQIAKFDPKNWGDGLSLDFTKLSEEDKKAASAVNRGNSTLSVKELESHRVPEVNSTYVNFLEKGWKENVAK
ncbi:MAG: ABC transporter substrate-binding protein [Clostridium sp.]